jgi:hypothetical protein
VQVIAPGHSREKDSVFLKEAGASFILSPGMAELLSLLDPEDAKIQGSPSKKRKTT